MTIMPIEKKTKKKPANEMQLAEVQAHFEEIKKRVNQMIRLTSEQEFFKGDPNKEIPDRIRHEGQHVVGLLQALFNTSQVNSCTGELENPMAQLLGLHGGSAGDGN